MNTSLKIKRLFSNIRKNLYYKKNNMKGFYMMELKKNKIFFFYHINKIFSIHAFTSLVQVQENFHGSSLNTAKKVVPWFHYPSHEINVNKISFLCSLAPLLRRSSWQLFTATKVTKKQKGVKRSFIGCSNIARRNGRCNHLKSNVKLLTRDCFTIWVGFLSCSFTVCTTNSLKNSHKI